MTIIKLDYILSSQWCINYQTESLYEVLALPWSFPPIPLVASFTAVNWTSSWASTSLYCSIDRCPFDEPPQLIHFLDPHCPSFLPLFSWLNLLAPICLQTAFDYSLTALPCYWAWVTICFLSSVQLETCLKGSFPILFVYRQTIKT